MNGNNRKGGLGRTLVFGLSMSVLLGVGSASGLGAGAKSDGKVELKVAKVGDLVKAIEANKGKVVLVDFWATFCPPCIEKFPKVVHLYDEYRDKGLVCISVTFDGDKKHDIALDFLTKNKATFANFRADNPDDFQDRWDFTALPTYLVFGKDGKLVQRFTLDPDAKKQFSFEDVQQTVEKQLK
jgi:thiol-disulfide isomerase/thioredoxin